MMAILTFPGGPVVVNDGNIWDKLQDWIDADPGYRQATQWRNSSVYCCKLWSDGVEVIRSSRHGFADAIGNALQEILKIEAIELRKGAP